MAVQAKDYADGQVVPLNRLATFYLLAKVLWGLQVFHMFVFRPKLEPTHGNWTKLICNDITHCLIIF